MADFKIGNITPLIGDIKAGSTDVVRIMNGTVQVWPEPLPGITWSDVVSLIPNGGPTCDITIVQARSLVPINDNNIIVGTILYKFTGGSPIPLDSGTYRMSLGLQDGVNYDINTIAVSTYYITVNTFGTITSKVIC